METRWGLSGEEVADYLSSHKEEMEGVGNRSFGMFRLGSRATLRHVCEEGEKPCIEAHGFSFATGQNVPWVQTNWPKMKKRECEKCWAELNREAGL